MAVEQNRAVLFLVDPQSGPAKLPRNVGFPVNTLIFQENERYLSQAQTALWELRKSCPWVCVAAAGTAASVGVALAAQLPVERLILVNSHLFGPELLRLPRQLARLRRYARHNLALVVSEIVLVDAQEMEIEGFVPCLHRRPLCVLPALENWGELVAPWTTLNEKNLLNPGKCV